ncbi:MAG TPA: DUF6141 family protein, partial [bacterium]
MEFHPAHPRYGTGLLTKMTIQEKPLFTEIQQFRQAWILLIILAVAAIFWCGAFIQIIPGRPFGNSPATDRVLLVFWVICGILLPVLFFSMKLTAHVRSDGIYLRFFPIDFKFQKISFSQLKSYEVRIYHPIREYGGWGIRYGRKG